MTRQIIIVILWTAVLYFGTCAIAGAIVHANSTQDHPAKVQDEIASVIFPHRPYILIGAIAIAGIGTWTGWLPGTGTKKSEN
jgi:hypothetical protein